MDAAAAHLLDGRCLESVQGEHRDHVRKSGGNIQEPFVCGQTDGGGSGGRVRGEVLREYGGSPPQPDGCGILPLIDKQFIAQLADQKQPPARPVENAVAGAGARFKRNGSGFCEVLAAIIDVYPVQQQAGNQHVIAGEQNLMTARPGRDGNCPRQPGRFA